MPSPKKYLIKQEAENWTACELSVTYKPGFMYETPIDNSESAHKLLLTIWDKERLNMQEQIVAFFINAGKRIIGYKLISTGDMHSAAGNTKLIASFALQTLSCSVILAHNHPGGGLVPSKADVALTQQLKDALRLIEVTLLDHLIIAERRYFSMWDEGFM
jgi:DNA repair protein RadC